MTQYLWSKSESANPTHERVQHFMSGQDVVLDEEIFLFDIWATWVHARGLTSIEILLPDELTAIEKALKELAHQFQAGTYRLGPPFEDGHSAIEFWLTEKLGAIGQKVHTGRSRNDQVQVAMRMYLRDQMSRLQNACRDLATSCLARAADDAATPMPGYTHLQRAVPSSIGLWMAGFAESFIDISALAELTRRWVDCCPLGTAAGYGVNLPLPRDEVAAGLQFPRLQMNPMYVQNSRGRFELQCLASLAQGTLELRRLCWDLSLFTSQEFSFVELASDFVTGSSIMPNKSNPDFVELARAQHAVVQGAISELQGLLSLPSGYQRDLQLTKPPVIRAFSSSLAALELSQDLIQTMTFNRPAMAAAIDPVLHSTDVAIDRVTREGVPFREAYRSPLTDQDLVDRTPESSVAARVSPGACGDLQLEALRSRLAAIESCQPSGLESWLKE